MISGYGSSKKNQKPFFRISDGFRSSTHVLSILRPTPLTLPIRFAFRHLEQPRDEVRLSVRIREQRRVPGPDGVELPLTVLPRDLRIPAQEVPDQQPEFDSKPLKPEFDSC